MRTELKKHPNLVKITKQNEHKKIKPKSYVQKLNNNSDLREVCADLRKSITNFDEILSDLQSEILEIKDSPDLAKAVELAQESAYTRAELELWLLS